MALIKCTECGQDISTDAVVCPHCGKPNTPPTISTPQVPKQKSGAIPIIIGFIIIILAVWGLNSVLGKTNFSFDTLKIEPIKQVQQSLGTLVPLTEVHNLGYIFYVGQIDNKDAVNITDDLKNQTTKIAYEANFPIELLKTIPIIILNNLALTGDQYIQIGGKNLKIPELKPDFLSEGGLHLTFSTGSQMIIINKPIIAKGMFRDVLTHELGHAIGSKMTDDDWKEFYQLRNIPTDTPRYGSVWNLSPAEDFAEAYKNTYTGLQVKTFYGTLKPPYGTDLGTCNNIYYELQNKYTPKNDDPFAYALGKVKIDYSAIESKINSDPKMQSCRRDVLSNPSAHPSDWFAGTPYVSVVDSPTKDFIRGLKIEQNTNTPKKTNTDEALKSARDALKK